MSVKRRAGDGAWFYRFTYKGKDYCEGGFRTSGQAGEAERLMNNKAIAQSLHPEDYAGEMTFRQGGEWWLKEYAPIKRSRKNDFSRVPVAIDYFGDRPMRDIQPMDIELFLSKLSALTGRHIGDHTRNHYLAAIHAIYERLKYKRMYRGENPASFVDKIEVPRTRVRFIYPAEEKILTPIIAENADLFDYYIIGVELGLRIDEMRNILVKHVDMVMFNIFVGAPGHRAKNNKSRYVRFDTPWDPGHSVIGLVKRRMSGKGPEDYLLPHWGYTYIAGRFKDACKAANILLEKGEAVHVLRHSFAYHRLSHGQPLYMVSKLMGHSGQAVTETHYGHLDLSTMGDVQMSAMPFLSCNRIATSIEKTRQIINEITSTKQ